MRIERTWAMPNKHTFLIKPIAQLLKEEMADGIWIDPFCGENSPAAFTNDLNPNISQAQTHLDALDYLKLFPNGFADGILIDPPYSLAEVIRIYREIKPDQAISSFDHPKIMSQIRDDARRILKDGCKAICFGWNSVGIGKTRGFELIRILLVCHGGSRNDTIITVEVKR